MRPAPVTKRMPLQAMPRHAEGLQHEEPVRKQATKMRGNDAMNKTDRKLKALFDKANGVRRDVNILVQASCGQYTTITLNCVSGIRTPMVYSGQSLLQALDAALKKHKI